MSYVFDEIFCRKCKYPKAHYEINLRTRDDWTLCLRCGYQSFHELKNDKMIFEEKEGLAAYVYKRKDQPGIWTGGMQSKNQMVQFRKWVEKNSIELKKVELRYQKNNEWIVEDIIEGTIKPFSERSIDF